MLRYESLYLIDSSKEQYASNQINRDIMGQQIPLMFMN